MNNADRQALRAIGQNPFPVEVSVTTLAGIVESMGQQMDELKARLAVAEAYARAGCACGVTK